MGPTYDGLFFDYIERGILSSARRFVGALASLKIGSVLEVGVVAARGFQHAPIVLFFAALPSESGLHHFNEEPRSFWRKLFADRGYVPFDCVRRRQASRR